LYVSIPLFLLACYYVLICALIHASDNFAYMYFFILGGFLTVQTPSLRFPVQRALWLSATTDPQMEKIMARFFAGRRMTWGNRYFFRWCNESVISYLITAPSPTKGSRFFYSYLLPNQMLFFQLFYLANTNYPFS
jgi:hypothetical protein